MLDHILRVLTLEYKGEIKGQKAMIRGMCSEEGTKWGASMSLAERTAVYHLRSLPCEQQHTTSGAYPVEGRVLLFVVS